MSGSDPDVLVPQHAASYTAGSRLLWTALGSALVLVSIGVSLLVLASVVETWPDGVFGRDFVAYWTGSHFLGNGLGSTLYDLEAQKAFQVAVRYRSVFNPDLLSTSGFLPYINPPAVAALVVPLGQLPMSSAFLLWNTMGLAATVVGISWNLAGSGRARLKCLALLTFPAVTLSLVQGQANFLLLLGVAGFIAFQRAGRPLASGAALGFLFVKPQYALPYLAVLLFARRWKEVAGFGLAAGLLSVASAALVGLDGVAEYLSVLSWMGGYQPPPGAQVSPGAMANWRGLLVNLAPGTPPQIASMALLALAVSTLLLYLSLWGRNWDPSSPQFGRQMLALATMAVTTSPHSHFHGAVVVLPAAALLLAREGPVGRNGSFLHAIIWAGYALGLLAVPFPSFSWLLAPYGLALVLALGLASGPGCVRTPRRTRARLLAS